MKAGPDFFKVWGGISGCQSLLSLLLTDGYSERKLPLSTIARVTSEYVAERFDFAPQKGRIEIGVDADMTLLDLGSAYQLEAGDLFYRHKHSPYLRRNMRAKVVRTIVRGTTVLLDGKIVSTPVGRLITPGRADS